MQNKGLLWSTCVVQVHTLSAPALWFQLSYADAAGDWVRKVDLLMGHRDLGWHQLWNLYNTNCVAAGASFSPKQASRSVTQPHNSIPSLLVSLCDFAYLAEKKSMIGFFWTKMFSRWGKKRLWRSRVVSRNEELVTFRENSYTIQLLGNHYGAILCTR